MFDGVGRISNELLNDVEDEYSEDRLRAVVDEWFENYGNLAPLFNLLKRQPSKFQIKSMLNLAEDFFVKLLSDGTASQFQDGLKDDFELFKTELNTEKLLKAVLALWYDVGIIGVKETADSAVRYAHIHHTHYEADDFTDETKFYVHPMFQRALRVRNS